VKLYIISRFFMPSQVFVLVEYNLEVSISENSLINYTFFTFGESGMREFSIPNSRHFISSLFPVSGIK
jgi:hypothetical protein